jgi:hypothetical protein
VQERALVVRVDELWEDSRFIAFQAGFQMTDAYGDKRQRIEEVRPYPSAPQASVKPVVSCHYWNGDNCDFEVTTKRQCRFQEGHVQGVNTFVKPFVAKQLDMEESEREQLHDQAISQRRFSIISITFMRLKADEIYIRGTLIIRAKQRAVKPLILDKIYFVIVQDSHAYSKVLFTNTI